MSYQHIKPTEKAVTKPVYSSEAKTVFTDKMSDSAISSDYDDISSASMSASKSLDSISDDYFSSLNSMENSNSLSSISASDYEFAHVSDSSDYQR